MRYIIFYRATIIIKCDMDFVLYPLDVQTCAVDFGSCKRNFIIIFFFLIHVFAGLLYYVFYNGLFLNYLLLETTDNKWKSELPHEKKTFQLFFNWWNQSPPLTLLLINITSKIIMFFHLYKIQQIHINRL